MFCRRTHQLSFQTQCIDYRWNLFFKVEKSLFCILPSIEGSRSSAWVSGARIRLNPRKLESITWGTRGEDHNSGTRPFTRDDRYCLWTVRRGVEVVHLPFYKLATKFGDLDQSKTYLLYCERGVMSRLQALYLQDNGFNNVKVYRI